MLKSKLTHILFGVGLIWTAGALSSPQSTLIGASSVWALEPGAALPSFSAKNQDGKTITQADVAGKPVLFYFYPKDETPGCTKEACQFRDEFSKFKKKGALVFGVSRQDEKSHQAFRAKHKIPFDLLVDADGSLATAMGVDSYPMVAMHKRQSVLFGADGKLIRFYESVTPEKHPGEVLADLEKATAPKAP